MPLIVENEPCGSQPDFPVQLSEKWAHGCVFALSAIGNPWDDAVRGGNSFTLTGTISKGVGRLGRFTDFDGSSYYTKAGLAIPPPVSFLVVGKGSTSTTAYALGGSGNLAADNERVQFDIYSGTPRSIFVNTAGSAAIASSSLAVADNEDYVVLFTVDANLVPRVYFKNAVTVGSAGTGTVGTYTGARVGAIAKLSTPAPVDKPIYLAAAWNRCFSDAEAYSLIHSLSAPWQIYEEEESLILSSPSSGITASANITQASDTSSSTAILVLAADASITASGDTASSTSLLSILVDANITQSSDTSTADGSVVISADASVTQAGDTLSSTATLASDTITANADITQTGDTTDSTSALLLSVSADITQEGDTPTAYGTLAVAVDASITQSSDSVTATANIGGITADASITQADNSITAEGALSIAVDAAINQAGDVLSFDATTAVASKWSRNSFSLNGSALNGVALKSLKLVGLANIVQASDTAAAVSALAVAASANITQSGDTCVATNEMAVTASAGITQSSDASISASILLVASSVNITQSNDTSIASGSLLASASANVMQYGDTLTATISSFYCTNNVMRRPMIDRTMRRQFTDRTMRTGQI